MPRAASAFCSTIRIVVPSRLMASTVSRMRSTSTGARPSDGSSSISRRGRAISARPMASICCSPPDMRAGTLLLALAQPREQVEDPLHVARDGVAVVALEGAELEVLVHRHAPEDLAPLRALRDAEPHDLVTGRPWISLPSKRIVPFFGEIRPEIVRSVVDLPAPLEPISETISPACTAMETPLTAAMLPYETWRSLTSSTRGAPPSRPVAGSAAGALTAPPPPRPRPPPCRDRPR